jgi:hypothetical protein
MFRREFLQPVFLCLSLFLIGSRNVAAQTPPEQALPNGGDFAPMPAGKLPTGVILVKGAEPSASDRATPLPEEGRVARNVYQNRYLGLTYPLPPDWMEAVQGPPPSDRGGYVLAQLIPAATFKRPTKGTVLISAQDMFFVHAPAGNALEMIKFSKEHLQPYYEVERSPTEVTIAGHSFARFDYVSHVAQLHWYVLATQIRCHTIQFVFTGQDVEMLESLIGDMNRMTLPAEAGATSGRGGGDSPVCVQNYALAKNIEYRTDPIFDVRRFNPVPVRIVIDKKGAVRHVHVISAFSDQATKITEALLQWKFKPYVQDGKAVEVETGIMFGSRDGITAIPSSTSLD